MAYPYAVPMILDHFPNLKAEYVTEQLRFSSFVSVPKRYMYFAVAKAACTQMRELLRTVEGAPPIQILAGRVQETRRDMSIHARVNVPLPSLVDLDDKTQRKVLESPDFLRMTFVRNPYTRLVSAWRNRVLLCAPGQDLYLPIKGHPPELGAKSLITFEEFVDYLATQCDWRTCDVHWQRQVDHSFFAALNYSFVGKIEHMAEGLRRFQQHLGLSEPFVAGGRNVSASIGVATYNKALADKVYSLYQPDFEALGYDRNAWPAGCENSIQASQSATVPVDTFIDEVIERNLVIAHLYQERNRLRDERDQLQDEMRKVSRLHLLALADGLIAFRRVSLKFLLQVKAWMCWVLRSEFVSAGDETGASGRARSGSNSHPAVRGRHP